VNVCDRPNGEKKERSLFLIKGNGEQLIKHIGWRESDKEKKENHDESVSTWGFSILS
jgi:hypothetical protein